MTRIGRALRANARVVAVVAAAAVLGVAGLLEAAAGAVLAIVLLTVPARRRRSVADVEVGTETVLRKLDEGTWVFARSGSFEHLVRRAPSCSRPSGSRERRCSARACSPCCATAPGAATRRSPDGCARAPARRGGCSGRRTSTAA